MKNTQVIAEEQILNSLQSHENIQDVKIGLIIGQCTHQKLYVVHFAPLPKQSIKAIASVKKGDLEDISEHAKYVTRMLPGGLWVLGAYVISDGPLFNNSNNVKLKNIVEELDVSDNQGFCYYGKYPSDSYLLFHYDVTGKQYNCQSIDKSKEFQLVDWKFQNKTSPWYHINTDFGLNGTFLDTSKDITFHDQIEDFIDDVIDKLENISVYLFDKEWEPSNYLEQIVQNKKSDETVFDVTLYHTPKKEGSSEVRTGDSAAQLEVTGSIRSRVSLHPRTTFEEASKAVRQDIIRSLSTRLELHWDSLVGEENRALEEGERVHEPPRRVLIQPPNWNVFVADYLYPGEEIDQAIKSCQDLLGITIEEKDIIENFETAADGGTVLSDVVKNANYPWKKAPFQKVPMRVFAAIVAVYVVGFSVFVYHYQ